MRDFLTGRRARLAFTATLALTFCAVVLCSARAVRADSSKLTWLDDNQSVVVSNGDTLTDSAYNALVQTSAGLYTSLHCATGSLQTDDCRYQTSAGNIAQAGQQVQLHGMEAPGYIVDTAPDPADPSSYNPHIQLVVPTPDQQVFLQLVQDEATGRYHIYFRTAATMAVQPVPNPWGAPFYMFDTPVSDATRVPELTDTVDWNVLYGNVTYSANGRQLALYDASGFVTLVDLQTLAIRTVQVADVPYDGSTPFARIAPSDDGKYLAVSVAGGDLSVYDLQRCEPAAHAPQTCPERDLQAPLAGFMGQLTNSPLGGGVVQFLSDDLLEYTASDSTLGGNPQYYLRAPNTRQSNYIALGDSYASGEGEGNDMFFPETNVPGANQCHLSPYSYPYLIRDDLNITSAPLTSMHSVACSGATISNVLADARYSNSPPNNTLGHWLPGLKPEIKYLNKSTDIITLSISGNDVGFGQIVSDCVRPDICDATYEKREELVTLINKQFDRLVALYTQLKHTAAPDVRIYVIGYPGIINPGGDCGDNVRLDSTETVFAHDLIVYLDSVIKRAAQKAGVYYVNDLTAFDGQRLCDSSTDKAVNGVDIEWYNGRPTKNNSFHPTLEGHQLLAQWIENTTDNFTAPMPRADSTVLEPTLFDGATLLQGAKTGQPLDELDYEDDLTQDIVNRGESISVTYNDQWSKLQPNTTVEGWLHSSPINLGTFTANSEGGFTATVTIPSDLEPGFHTLDFYGMGIDGQTQDITETIDVIASMNDLDGDGIINAVDSDDNTITTGAIHNHGAIISSSTHGMLTDEKPEDATKNSVIPDSNRDTPGKTMCILVLMVFISLLAILIIYVATKWRSKSNKK